MAPALRIPVSVNTEQFQQQMSALGQVTSRAAKTMRNEFIKLNAEVGVEAVLAFSKFGLAVGKAVLETERMQKAIAKMRFIGGNILTGLVAFEAISLAFKAMSEITEFARLKIEEFVKTQEKAAAAGVSADFFQRWVEGGKAIKLSIDDATAALNRFAESAKDKLGGSDLQKRIVELQQAGNQIDSKAFEGAIGNQAKLEAFVAMVDKMRDSGLVLASIDLTDKFLGGKVAEAFRADAGYLDQMLASAKAIEATKIINQDDINRAVDLTNRMDAARKLMEEKWIPLQQQVLKLGLDYNESWINLYNNIAQVVSIATSLFGIFDKIGAKLNSFGSSSFWTKMTEVTGKLGLNSVPAGVEFAPFKDVGSQSPAQKALGSSLSNPALITDAKRLATEVSNKMRPDLSKPPGQPKPTAAAAADTDFLGKQNEQIEKHISLMKAETEAEGQGVAKKEELKTMSLLLTAAEKDNVTVTEELKEAMQVMAEQAGAAAKQLDEARKKMADIKSAVSEIGSQVSGAFADAIIEGKKLNEIMSSLLKNIARMAINKTFSKVFDIIGNSITAGIGAKAGGGPIVGGDPYLVGEKGPELIIPSRSGMVIPNDVLKSSGSMGGAIVYSPAIDARGASVEAVARLAQIMETDRASFASRTVQTIQQARRNRIPGM